MILMVDDEQPILNLFTRFLKIIQKECVTALNFDDARSLFFDLVDEIKIVFIDLNLPGQRGIDLAQWLKDKKEDVVVIMTSGDEPELNVLLEQYPQYIDAVLKKPFKLQDLQSYIEKYQ